MTQEFEKALNERRAKINQLVQALDERHDTVNQLERYRATCQHIHDEFTTMSKRYQRSTRSYEESVENLRRFVENAVLIDHSLKADKMQPLANALKKSKVRQGEGGVASSFAANPPMWMGRAKYHMDNLKTELREFLRSLVRNTSVGERRNQHVQYALSSIKGGVEFLRTKSAIYQLRSLYPNASPDVRSAMEDFGIVREGEDVASFDDAMFQGLMADVTEGTHELQETEDDVESSYLNCIEVMRDNGLAECTDLKVESRPTLVDIQRLLDCVIERVPDGSQVPDGSDYQSRIDTIETTILKEQANARAHGDQILLANTELTSILRTNPAANFRGASDAVVDELRQNNAMLMNKVNTLLNENRELMNANTSRHNTLKATPYARSAKKQSRYEYNKTVFDAMTRLKNLPPDTPSDRYLELVQQIRKEINANQPTAHVKRNLFGELDAMDKWARTDRTEEMPKMSRMSDYYARRVRIDQKDAEYYEEIGTKPSPVQAFRASSSPVQASTPVVDQVASMDQNLKKTVRILADQSSTLSETQKALDESFQLVHSTAPAPYAEYTMSNAADSIAANDIFVIEKRVADTMEDLGVSKGARYEPFVGMYGSDVLLLREGVASGDEETSLFLLAIGERPEHSMWAPLFFMYVDNDRRTHLQSTPDPSKSEVASMWIRKIRVVKNVMGNDVPPDDESPVPLEIDVEALATMYRHQTAQRLTAPPNPKASLYETNSHGMMTRGKKAAMTAQRGGGAMRDSDAKGLLIGLAVRYTIRRALPLLAIKTLRYRYLRARPSDTTNELRRRRVVDIIGALLLAMGLIGIRQHDLAELLCFDTLCSILFVHIVREEGGYLVPWFFLYEVGIIL